jgi:hypothetical protein
MLRAVQSFFRASLRGVPVVCPTAVHDIVVGSALSHPDTKLQAVFKTGVWGVPLVCPVA